MDFRLLPSTFNITIEGMVKDGTGQWTLHSVVALQKNSSRMRINVPSTSTSRA